MNVSHAAPLLSPPRAGPQAHSRASAPREMRTSSSRLGFACWAAGFPASLPGSDRSSQGLAEAPDTVTHRFHHSTKGPNIPTAAAYTGCPGLSVIQMQKKHAPMSLCAKSLPGVLFQAGFQRQQPPLILARRTLEFLPATPQHEGSPSEAHMIMHTRRLRPHLAKRGAQRARWPGVRQTVVLCSDGFGRRSLLTS